MELGRLESEKGVSFNGIKVPLLGTILCCVLTHRVAVGYAKKPRCGFLMLRSYVEVKIPERDI